MTYAMHCAGCGWKGEISCHVLKLDRQLCPDCGAPRPTLRQDYSKKSVVIPRWFHTTEGHARHKQELEKELKKNPGRYEYIGPRRSGQEIQIGKGVRIR